jgi:CRP-like cAMP-binding protein
MQPTLPGILPLLRDVTIFGGLTDETIRHIVEQCSVISFKAREVVIQEGTPGKEIYIILKGRVKVVLGLDTDHPLEVTEFGPGNCLGEVSLIGILTHSASVMALEDTEVLVISKQLLMDIVKDDKNLFSLLILNIARELARRLYHTNEILLHYGSGKK